MHVQTTNNVLFFFYCSSKADLEIEENKLNAAENKFNDLTHSHEKDKRKDKIDPSLTKKGVGNTKWMRFDPHDALQLDPDNHLTSNIGVFSATCGEVSFDAGTLKNLVCKGSGGVIFTHGGFSYSTLVTQVRHSEGNKGTIEKGGQDVVDAINSLDKNYFMAKETYLKSVVWYRDMWFGRGKNEHNNKGQLDMCNRIKKSVKNVLKASQVVLGHTRVCTMKLGQMPPGCKLKTDTKGDGVMHCKCDVPVEGGGENNEPRRPWYKKVRDFFKKRKSQGN